MQQITGLKRNRQPVGTTAQDRNASQSLPKCFAEVCQQLKQSLEDDLKRRRVVTGSNSHCEFRQRTALSVIDADGWEEAVRPVTGGGGPLPELSLVRKSPPSDHEPAFLMEETGSTGLSTGGSRYCLSRSPQSRYEVFDWNVSPLFRLPRESLHVHPGILAVPSKLDQITQIAQANEPGRQARTGDGDTTPKDFESTRHTDGDPEAPSELDRPERSGRRGNLDSKDPHSTSSSVRHAPSTTGEAPLSSDPMLLDWIQLRLKRRPTIIVPAGLTSELVTDRALSIINFDNALQFFESGHLVTDPQKLRELSVGRAGNSDSKFSFLYKLPNKKSPVKFQVVSTSALHRFDKADWESVVAVLLSGVDWQFKSWPSSGIDHALERLRGFYCTFKDSPLPRVATHPRCQVLTFPRILRHNDTELKRVFWQLMVSHLSKHVHSLPEWNMPN